MADPGPVHPTRDDPVLAGASEAIGGPAGSRTGRHRWWTPVRVLLALAAVVLALGMVQKSSCYVDTWADGHQRYAHMCYSDLPYLYTGRGLAELAPPYTDDAQVRERYPAMEYPVGIASAAWGTAALTQWLHGSPDLALRRELPTDAVGDLPGIGSEQRAFVALTAVSLAVAGLLATWFAAGVNRGRPWDAAGFAAAPVLGLTAIVNWDLYAVVLLVAALWAWTRDRPLLTGVLVGLGAATKLYPLFLLGGVLVICLRRRDPVTFVRTSAAAALAWATVNLPAYLAGPESWRHFWSFNSDRGADLGSLWLVVQQASGHELGADLVNRASLLLFGGWCLVVLLVGITAPRTPRLAQLGFLVVAGFLLVNKVYSPQYVLWLLPLAALARPRWRDLLMWQAGEVAYFAAVWWYLGDLLAAPGGGQPVGYWIAILLRVAAQVHLVVGVLRDVRHPEQDPVAVTDPASRPLPGGRAPARVGPALS